MIEIRIKLDSVEGRKDALTFNCDWKIVSDEITENEEASAKFILKRVQEMFDDLSTNALLAGGSVKYRNTGSDNGKGKH